MESSDDYLFIGEIPGVSWEAAERRRGGGDLVKIAANRVSSPDLGANHNGAY